MARLGEKRASDVLDYDRDIKGKGLVRLRAGVGAGKNHWVRHLPETHPDLQILMITSRKNTAEAEAYRVGTDCKIRLNKLIDVEDKILLGDIKANLVICTNAYIEKFFRNVYDPDNPVTHLWNKFDVIFVDEAHSICSDATFTDGSFYVERFIYHTREKNPNCDVVLMSGTTEPIDWLFDEEHLGECVDLDIYDQCVHLVPNNVILMTRQIAAQRLYNLWKNEQRAVYFVSSVKAMSVLIDRLEALGVTQEDIGIAYTSKENEDLLPPNLVQSKDSLRECLVEQNRIPSEIKIFITTAQNKEGISIVDDDVRYMFSESTNKADLEQMAGRIRGNPEAGKGIGTLVVVYDANKSWEENDFVERELDFCLPEHADDVLRKHEALFQQRGKSYSREKDIQVIHNNHRYLRYDYIGECVRFYAARAESESQNVSDSIDLASYVTLYDQVLWYECKKGDLGNFRAVTGRSLLEREWFPYSKLFYTSEEEKTPAESAAEELMLYLRENKLLDACLTTEQTAQVRMKIQQLIRIYGKSNLNFRKFPKSLKPALERFGLTIVRENHKTESAKIIPMNKKVVKGTEDLGEESEL